MEVTHTTLPQREDNVRHNSSGGFRSGKDKDEWINIWRSYMEGSSTQGDTVFVVGGTGVHMSTDEGANCCLNMAEISGRNFRSKTSLHTVLNTMAEEYPWMAASLDRSGL
jgi:hypothetical protein